VSYHWLRFKSSERWNCVKWYIVTNVSEELASSNFRIGLVQGVLSRVKEIALLHRRSTDKEIGSVSEWGNCFCAVGESVMLHGGGWNNKNEERGRLLFLPCSLSHCFILVCPAYGSTLCMAPLFPYFGSHFTYVLKPFLPHRLLFLGYSEDKIWGISNYLPITMVSYCKNTSTFVCTAVKTSSHKVLLPYELWLPSIWALLLSNFPLVNMWHSHSFIYLALLTWEMLTKHWKKSLLWTCARDGHLRVWWYQMLYNTILTSWWWAHSARNI